MEKLFVYGTLKHPEIQKKILGRSVDLRDATLRHFQKGEVKINEKTYPIAISEASSTITSKIIEITPEELEKIDTYETAAYRRIRVKLESGEQAWVYCSPSR